MTDLYYYYPPWILVFAAEPILLVYLMEPDLEVPLVSKF